MNSGRKRLLYIIVTTVFLSAFTIGCGNRIVTPIAASSDIPASSTFESSAYHVEGSNTVSSSVSGKSSQPVPSESQSITAFRLAINMDRYGLVYRCDKAGCSTIKVKMLNGYYD